MSAMKELERRVRAARPQSEATPPPLAAILARIEQAQAAQASRGHRWHRRPSGWQHRWHRNPSGWQHRWHRNPSGWQHRWHRNPSEGQHRWHRNPSGWQHRWHRNPSEGQHRWHRSRIAVPAALAAIVLAGAGGGALLLTPGKPVAPAFVLPADPETGLGRPVAASLALLPMRVPDPAGGPPWAMRVIRTTRGLVCLQAGRVLDSQLGALGTGYAFGADGRFHPFLPEDAIATDACPVAGSNGLAFLPGPPVLVPANALPLAGENVKQSDQVHCDLPGQENWGLRCPQSELRQVAMGLLPGATSIEVNTPGRTFTVKPYGREGTYLIVLPAQPAANTGISSGAWSAPFGYVSHARGGAVLTVAYGDGSQCQIPASTQKRCSAKAAPTKAVQPSNADALARGVHVSYVPLDRHPVAPLIATARSSTPSQQTFQQQAFRFGSGAEPPGPALTIGFQAPVAAASASTAYVVELRPQQVPGCATPGLIVSQPSEQTISAGQHVEMTVPLQNSCATSYSGRVFVARSSGIGGESGGEGPLYEAIAAQFGPGPGRDPAKFPTVGRFWISVP